MLVMDQKVTTQPVLAELDQRGIKFLTLQMRSTALVRHINTLRPADYKTITLDRSGHHNRAPRGAPPGFRIGDPIRSRRHYGKPTRSSANGNLPGWPVFSTALVCWSRPGNEDAFRNKSILLGSQSVRHLRLLCAVVRVSHHRTHRECAAQGHLATLAWCPRQDPNLRHTI